MISHVYQIITTRNFGPPGGPARTAVSDGSCGRRAPQGGTRSPLGRLRRVLGGRPLKVRLGLRLQSGTGTEVQG